MSRKKDLIISGIIAIIVIVVAVGYFVGWLKSPLSTVSSPAVPGIPAGTVAPGVNATGTPPNVAVPGAVVPAALGAGVKLRVFNISADNGVFTPSTIIVNQNDRVAINFTAVDKAYDITIPGYDEHQSAKMGQIGVLTFQAVKPGKFAYYCESCGGLSSSATGSLLVIPRATSTPPAS